VATCPTESPQFQLPVSSEKTVFQESVLGVALLLSGGARLVFFYIVDVQLVRKRLLRHENRALEGGALIKILPTVGNHPLVLGVMVKRVRRIVPGVPKSDTYFSRKYQYLH